MSFTWQTSVVRAHPTNPSLCAMVLHLVNAKPVLLVTAHPKAALLTDAKKKKSLVVVQSPARIPVGKGDLLGW
jgi:hypothetical protein